MNLSLWNPFKNNVVKSGNGSSLFAMDDFDKWFDDFWGKNRVFSPSIELKDKGKNYEIVAELPGLSKEDFHVELKDNSLTITGERKVEKEEKRDGSLYSERSYGRFARSFTLPEGVEAEKIQASHKDGILKIEIPKPAELQKTALKIEVK